MALANRRPYLNRRIILYSKAIGQNLLMKNWFLAIALLLIPVLLIISGFYFKNDVLSSIGYVFLIFYIIMAVRGRFKSNVNNSGS